MTTEPHDLLALIDRLVAGRRAELPSSRAFWHARTRFWQKTTTRSQEISA
jgi:hypothetical protein